MLRTIVATSSSEDSIVMASTSGSFGTSFGIMSSNDMLRGGYVTSPEGSVARLEHGGTRRVDAAELFAERAGGSGCLGNGLAGGRRWAELSGGSTTGGAPRQ